MFQFLEEGVGEASEIPCMFNILRAPGVAIDYDRINVDFVAGDGVRTALFNVDDCGHDMGGWRYDNSPRPQQILLCPDVCVQVDDVVEVELGCDIRKGERQPL